MIRFYSRWFVGALLGWLVWSGWPSQSHAGSPLKLSWTVGPKQHRTKLYLRFSGFIRPEVQTNRGDYAFKSEDSDVYVASRIRVTGGVIYRKSVGIHVTLQDARFWGNALPSGGKIRFNTNTSEYFTRDMYYGLQLFESYLYLRWDEAQVDLKAGRIKVTYGDSFFIGDPGFIPTGQSFDGMLLSWKRNGFKLDLMWLMVRESVATDQIEGCEGKCFWEGDTLAGAYATKQFGKSNSVDLYGYYYQRAPRNASLKEQTQIAYLGVRYVLNHRIVHLSLEGNLQVGRHLDRNLLAGAGIVAAKIKIPVKTKPYFKVQGLFATGDGDPTDEAENNFLALFNKRRRFYGLINLYGLSNIIQPMVEFGLQPHKQLKLAVNFRYNLKMNAKGTMVAAGSHNPSLADLTGEDGLELGSEIDLSIKYAPFPGVQFHLGGGIFLPAKELHQRGVDGTITKTFGLDPAFMLFLNFKISLG